MSRTDHPRRRSITISLPGDLVEAIDNYNATDWKDGRDPSKLGALNAVAFIGERVAAIRASKKRPAP